jgi:hypothetical protein
MNVHAQATRQQLEYFLLDASNPSIASDRIASSSCLLPNESSFGSSVLM